MRLEARVLIIGGGPAGATAGRVLAASGVDTLILERDLAGAKPCGGGIPSGAFTELDLPQSIIRRKITRLRVFPPKSAPFQIDFPSGFIGIVDRKHFDAVLRDMARAEGAAVMQGQFSKFLHKDKGIMKVEALIGGQPAQVSAEYIIAADGVNSRVRAMLGLGRLAAVHTLGARVPVETDACEFLFGALARNGYGWVFPSAGKASVGLGGMYPACLKASLGRFFALRGLELPDSGVRGYRIPLWEPMPLASGKKVLFAGDSAGMVMPFTFEGIYYAMRSGALAAEALAEGRPALYGKLWKKRFHLRFLLMKTLWSTFMKDDAGTERLLGVFRDARIQQKGIRLWLDKSHARGSLSSFVSALRKYILF